MIKLYKIKEKFNESQDVIIYKDIVKYNLNASNNLLEILKQNNIKYNIIKEIYIEKNINN